MCVSLHACEKLLSETAVALFPSHAASLAQLPSAARSHDCPTLLPPFTFSSAWLAAEKQRRPASLAHSGPLLLSIVRQESEYVTEAVAQSERLGPKCRETNWSGEKGWLVFFFCTPFFLFVPSSWLIPIESGQREGRLEEVEVQPKDARERIFLYSQCGPDAVNGQWIYSPSAFQTQKNPLSHGLFFFSWVHHVLNQMQSEHSKCIYREHNLSEC